MEIFARFGKVIYGLCCIVSVLIILLAFYNLVTNGFYPPEDKYLIFIALFIAAGICYLVGRVIRYIFAGK
jgi:hypothetical protein